MKAIRQLSAILFADIVGYTSMMQENETVAIRSREKFFSKLTSVCEEHEGRIVQNVGDGAVCLFQSSIEAVLAAIDLQQEMQRSPFCPLRIGIHLGDVLINNENIYGNGVNIASRLESFAPPGAILCSGAVYDEIKNQGGLDGAFLGKFILKNVPRVIEIYAIQAEGVFVPETLDEGKGIRHADHRIFSTGTWVALIVGVIVACAVIFTQPSRQVRAGSSGTKVVAVIPFTNLSPSDESYFADGMCDEILSQLAKVSALNVLSRTSMLRYRNTDKSIREIGNEVGADVLLEGSVQKSDDQVRIIVQLIDAKTDKHLWAETYDREFKDIFLIQTDIARQIASALHTRLTKQELRMVDNLPTQNMHAYDMYLKGNKYAESFWDAGRMDETAQAVRMYKEAIRLDSAFSAAYYALVELYAEIYWTKPVIHSAAYRAEAKFWLDKMMTLGANNLYSHGAMAVYQYKCERNYHAALKELDQMDKIAGNDKATFGNRADILLTMGRTDDALEYLERLQELFPRTPRVWAETAELYKLKRDFVLANHCIDKAIAIAPDIAGYYVNKAMYYAELRGDLDSAGMILQQASRLVDTTDFDVTITYFEILRGNYDHAIERIRPNTDTMGIQWQYKFVPPALSIALMYHAQNKLSEAQPFFHETKVLTQALLTVYPDDFRYHATLGIACAGLGEKESALQAGNEAVRLMPVSTDALVGVSAVESLALIHALNGEHAESIQLLHRMLDMPFAWTMSNSKALYRLHYYWKSLHGNPAFQRLIAD